jgi:hypothetical protein
VSANYIETWEQPQPRLRWYRHPGCARWAVWVYEEPPPRVECVECSRVFSVRPAEEAA